MFVADIVENSSPPLGTPQRLSNIAPKAFSKSELMQNNGDPYGRSLNV